MFDEKGHTVSFESHSVSYLTSSDSRLKFGWHSHHYWLLSLSQFLEQLTIAVSNILYILCLDKDTGFTSNRSLAGRYRWGDCWLVLLRVCIDCCTYNDQLYLGMNLAYFAYRQYYPSLADQLSHEAYQTRISTFDQDTATTEPDTDGPCDEDSPLIDNYSDRSRSSSDLSIV